jgi:L-xylulokinase
MAKYLLGTDNGGTVSKAGLFTLDGKEIAVASRQTELLTPKAGFVERDMTAMLQATIEAIKEVVEVSGIDAADIVCLACTGHGNGIYLTDKDGGPTRNAIMSSDGRAREYTDRWAADGVDKAIRPKTMQCIWPAQPNALLAWIRDNEPDVLKASEYVFMAKDYIRFCLTGEAYAELTDMSGTSLMNVGTAEYDAEVLEAFGIGEMQRLLPPLKRTSDICGAITAKAAELTGLKEGTPVAGGMFDIDACGLACGITDESQLCVVVGTWGNNQYISDKPVVDGVFMTSCYSIDGYYLMLEGSATSAGNLEWFVNNFFRAEKQTAKEQGKSVYDICNELAESVDPAQSDVVFVPFLYGSNASPDAKASLIGLAGHHSRADVIRAIYEGVVFAHMTHMDNLKSFRKMPETIRLTGGAARSDVWLQIFADCFQATIEVPDGTELGTKGAAIAAGVASGCFDDYGQAIDKMVTFAKRIAPNPDNADLYRKKYARYRKIIDALDVVW